MSNEQAQQSPTAQPQHPVLTASAALEMRVKAAQRAHDDERDFGAMANEAAIKNGEEVIKAAILINGGSSVAMLAFIGTLAAQKVISSDQIKLVAAPLMYFGGGVICAVVGGAFAYFVNLAIAHASMRRQRSYEAPFLVDTPSTKNAIRTAEFLRAVAVLAVAGSIGLFAFGLFAANSAFKFIAPQSTPQMVR